MIDIDHETFFIEAIQNNREVVESDLEEGFTLDDLLTHIIETVPPDNIEYLAHSMWIRANRDKCKQLMADILKL